MQAIDPFFKISYQELGRDWAALAEEAEWLDSHHLPSPIGFSCSCSVEEQLSIGRATRAVGGGFALGHDAFQSELAGTV
jgi:hypothetical protein